MIYIVDKIEDNIAVLENKDTREIINVNISCLPSLIKEGSILKYDGSKYYIDFDQISENFLSKLLFLSRVWTGFVFCLFSCGERNGIMAHKQSL